MTRPSLTISEYETATVRLSEDSARAFARLVAGKLVVSLIVWRCRAGRYRSKYGGRAA